MAASNAACDVLVVGGGPAAATAGRLLARWGRRVVVVARPAGGEPELPESLTPSCGKFFDLLGIRARIDGAGFVRSAGHTVWWGSAAARAEPFADGLHGWQATTVRLSQVMLGAAADAGCVVERRGLSADEVLAWPAAWRIDCTGRSGVLAKPFGERRYEPGHRTVALVGRWRRDDAWPVDDPSHTLLESYADGWAWSIPLGATHRALAVMVDPATTALARSERAEGVYRAEVAKTGPLRRMVAGAVLDGGPWGWDASMYCAGRPAGDGWLLAGDAASFIDPLSSAGVKKAMASGWLAAVTVNTSLADPARAPIAQAFYAAREADTYAQFLGLTRQHLHEGAPGEHPFWVDRAGDGSPAFDTDRAAVERAYESVRRAPGLAVRRGDGVRIEPRPALTEREILLEPRLVTAELETGVRYLHGVDVVVLVELAPGCADVGELYERYGQRAGPAELPLFLTALATAIARGWLVGP
jgi:flavin-dependent dehydrogenase